jgi:predicted DNA-binding protein
LKSNAFSKLDYTTVYIGLPADLSKKLKKLAQKAHISESAILRQMLDKYFEKPLLSIGSCERQEALGLKVKPRTILKEQDKKLRELCNMTGRGMSELLREAVKVY